MITPNEQIAGKKARVKVPVEVIPIISRAVAEEVLLNLAEAANEKIKATAEMDAEILAVKEKYQGGLGELDVKMVNMTERLADYAGGHPELFPNDRKSVQWTAGKFGFRTTNPPSLALISRKCGWAQILEILRAKRMRRFWRTKLEVDKDAILSRCGTLEKPTKFQTEILPKLGIKLIQDEQFFVEPDLTKVEGR